MSPWTGARGSPLSTAVFIALIVAVSAEHWLFRSRAGFSLRAVGENANAAALYGIRLKATTVGAFMLSGALAGLAATSYVLGDKGYYEDGFSGGIGFTGIAVALLARNRPLWVIVSALLFAALSQGSLAINTLLPKEATGIVFAVIMATVLLGDKR